MPRKPARPAPPVPTKIISQSSIIITEFESETGRAMEVRSHGTGVAEEWTDALCRIMQSCYEQSGDFETTVKEGEVK